MLIGGTLGAGLEGMLWGGVARIFVLHHVTYSINSLCHFFGRRRFATEDESRNLLWLAPLSFGEAWHNNHHAFPTSAVHGLGRGEIDFSGILISALERAGLVWDVQRVSHDSQAAKALAIGVRPHTPRRATHWHDGRARSDRRRVGLSPRGAPAVDAGVGGRAVAG